MYLMNHSARGSIDTVFIDAKTKKMKRKKDGFKTP